MTRPIVKPFLLAAAAMSLGGCAYYGGYDSGGYSDGYYDTYYDPYYATSYYGWYDDFYYPGLGYYIYDRRGNRHQWNDDHRRHWEGQRRYRDRRNSANWDGFQRGDDGQYRDQRRNGHRVEGQRGKRKANEAIRSAVQGDRRDRTDQNPTTNNRTEGRSAQRQGQGQGQGQVTGRVRRGATPQATAGSRPVAPQPVVRSRPVAAPQSAQQPAQNVRSVPAQRTQETPPVAQPRPAPAARTAPRQAPRERVRTNPRNGDRRTNPDD